MNDIFDNAPIGEGTAVIKPLALTVICDFSHVISEATMQLKICRHKVSTQITSIKQKWIIKEFDKTGTLVNSKEEWRDIDEEALEG
jgi:hypothetical protein